MTSLAVGLMALPYTERLLPSFTDGGYGCARVFGFLLVSYFSWLLASIGLLPFSRTVLFALVALLFLVGVGLQIRARALPACFSNWRLIGIEEGVFVAAFIAMLLFRSCQPKIEGIEKIMDYAILNGLLRTDFMPPTDVWYSGASVNYYYFGHLHIATIIKLTRVPPAIGYNLAVAHIFALAAQLAFTVGHAVGRRVWLGLLAVFLLTAAGNLDLMVHTFTKEGTYFYASARGLIPKTINEFPTYSFLIGDLHAHILNIPFVLLFIALLVSLVQTKFVTLWQMAAMAVICGSFFATNSWDFLIYGGFCWVMLLLCEHMSWSSLLRAALRTGGVFLVGIVLFLPYHLNFNAPVGGVGWVNDRSGFFPILVMFGFFWLLVLPYLATAAVRRMQGTTLDTTDLMVSAAIAYGLVLIAVPEFVFLKDIYFQHNPPFYRANTVFKVWYQAWILLSVFSPWAVYQLFVWLQSRRALQVVWVLLLLVPFGFVAAYPVNAVRYITGKRFDPKGLDGTAYLTGRHDHEKAAIEWLNQHVDGQPVVLAATGESYTTDSIVSAYTGLPSPVGWSDHEFGWRVEWPPIAARLGDVEKIYQTTEPNVAEELLDKYQVVYIVIGPRERKKYGAAIGQVLGGLARPVFTTSELQILERIERDTQK